MPDAAPRRLALLALVSARFYGDGPHPLQLVCTTEDASDVECDQTIAEVEPGAEWDELEARIVAHAAEYHATGLEAAAPPDATFEDMLADPGEQFDPRSELLASIAAYAAAPSDTPSAAPRPLTAPDVVAGLLADVADARAQLADVQHGAGAWIREAAARETAGLTARLAEVTADRAHLAAKLAETLAANQRWAETLGDVQQRHAEVKRQRDAHKLRADHYEGLWRAEHGLPPEGNETEGNHA